jgi:transcriptional regulator with XRE-family HTH domain
LSLSPTAYSRIETGQTQITIENLFKICEALQTSIEDILMLDVKNVCTNNNNTILQQQCTIHSLNISLSPKEFNRLTSIFEKGK